MPDVATLTQQRAALVTYLRMKLDANDLHAVQDAASDIREIDAKLEVLREMGEPLTAGTFSASAARIADRAQRREFGHDPVTDDAS